MLQSPLDLSQKKDFALTGIDSITTITCATNIGVKFTNITNLTISNIVFQSCGQLHTSSNIRVKVAVLLSTCNTIFMSNTAAVDSDGTGLAMLNVTGKIEIVNSRFNRNRGSNKVSGGGGVYLEFASLKGTSGECEMAEYLFNNCSFVDNIATITDTSLNCDDGLFTGIGRGGGMSIRLQNYPCYVKIAVNNSTLSNNTVADWGGAVELVACRAQNNHIVFTNTTICNNTAGSTGGGGGMDIDFSGLGTHNNSISVSTTTFKDNTALYGGGAIISTRYAYDQSNNSVAFLNCSWIGNVAHYASAVDIFPAGVLDGWNSKPGVVFEDCMFQSNYHREEHIQEYINRLGEGVVMVTGFTVTYRGKTTFLNNSGSCIYAISSQVQFDNDADVLFHNNTAEKGAGIALIGFSVIAVGNNSGITFCNNNVTRKGAAIYYFSTDKHIYVNTKRCFIQKLTDSATNATFKFFGNKAPKNSFEKNSEYASSSIYTSTDLAACCQNDKNCTFDGVGNFLFCSKCDESAELMSCETPDNASYIDGGEKNFTFDLEKGSEVNATPGYLTKLPLKYSYNTTFDLTIAKMSNTNITVVNSHYSIHNNRVILTGKIGERANLTLTERSNRKYSLTFQIAIKDCPPLYKLSSDSLNCACYKNDETYYIASFRCDRKGKSVSLHIGYWVGYAETVHETKRSLYISYCPKAYGNKGTKGDVYYHLPTEHSELETAVCGPNRCGILCGECNENSTVYFYSRTFKCGKTDHCKWGPVFYLLSEIVPLTILFLFVVLCNISFTSGDLNGFIFFAQMYGTLADVGGSFVVQDSYLEETNLFIYRLFNLDFFVIDYMSFCLWEKANTLSILMFKYLTLVYALMLVLGTVLIVKLCSAFKCVRFRKLKYSVIQGLSAFIVMTYSQCTEISFSILNPINIYKGTRKNSTVVFLQGNIVYFSKEHLPYAIPALLCILTFVTIIPPLLMFYPLCNKVISFLKLEDSRLVQLTSSVIPISKIKPLFDCFQGTFKDNCRFFAGLYFAYRAAILASRFAPTILIIYAVMELQFIAMLILHTLFWPYQKKTHNIIDGLLIANLAIITILKLLMHIQAELIKFQHNIYITYAIESVLVSIPIFSLIIFVIYRIIKNVKQWCSISDLHKRDTKLLDTLFLEDDVRDQSLNTSTDSYMLMRERHSKELGN